MQYDPVPYLIETSDSDLFKISDSQTLPVTNGAYLDNFNTDPDPTFN
jgi:hypothetical protein